MSLNNKIDYRDACKELEEAGKMMAEGIKRAEEASRIDVIGQNGNDGAHYKGSFDDSGPVNVGLKYDQDKIRTELYPIEAFLGTCEILTFGAKKYEDRNWEKGIKYSRVYGALLRHIMAWFSGENLDPETNKSHLDHAACCIAFLQTYTKRNMKEFDDRP